MPQFCHRIRVRDRRTGATSEHRFTASTVRIGREADSELQLADPFVSAQHAILESDEHGARLRDLGGVNGLRIAGKRIAPHAVVAVGDHLSVSVGPYDLEIVHNADRDQRASSGALAEPGPAALTRLHATLRELHALHTPHVAARRAFEAALADAVHSLRAAGDPQAAGRILAEFPAADHAHLVLATPDLSLQTATPRTPPAHNLSLQPSSPRTPPGQNLSLQPSSPPPPMPPSARALDRPAPTAGPLALISSAAHTLLPGQRPPANLDEAARFLARLVATARTLAAGLGALQHLRVRQARDLGVGPVDGANPLLTLTDADELLAALLTTADEGERTPELLDCFAVLTGHARAHVAATLAAVRHLAGELAPAAIERDAPRSMLPGRTLWHAFVARYDACLGDAATGTLRASFRAAYLQELEHHGLAVAARPA